MINNSIKTSNGKYPKRYMVDAGDIFTKLEIAAIEDMAIQGTVISMPEYIRQILTAFNAIREYQRNHDLPLLTPDQITSKITGI
jgi:predicted alpha/beta superfamily hydrolase